MGAKGAKGRKPGVMSQQPDSKGLNVERGKDGLGQANINMQAGPGAVGGTRNFRKKMQNGDK